MENLATFIKIIDWKIINMAFKFLNKTGKNHENLGYEIWKKKNIIKYALLIVNIFFDLLKLI